MNTTATGSSTNRFMTITYDGGQMILDPIAFVVKHNITDTRDLCRWVLKIAYDREEVIGEIIKRLDKAKEERPDLFDSSISCGTLNNRHRRLERAKYHVERLLI